MPCLVLVRPNKLVSYDTYYFFFVKYSPYVFREYVSVTGCSSCSSRGYQQMAPERRPELIELLGFDLLTLLEIAVALSRFVNLRYPCAFEALNITSIYLF